MKCVEASQEGTVRGINVLHRRYGIQSVWDAC